MKQNNMIMRRFPLVLIAFIAVFACKREVLVSSISVQPEELTLIEEENRTLAAIIRPSDAADKEVIWSSSNSSSVVVDDKGRITAIAPGTATITAKASRSAVYGHCDVTVLEKIRPSLKGLEGYELAWNDEFDYSGGPCDKWERVVWRIGTVNQEEQEYVDEPKVMEVSDGILKITAYPFGNVIKSGRLHSKQHFMHAYYEGRAKIPKGKGVWPAFWLMGERAKQGEWPLCGEVDILEAVGHMPKMVHSVIWADKYRDNEYMVDYYLPTSRDEFHIYAAEVTPEYVKIYVDNILVNEMHNERRGVEYYPYNDYYMLVVLNLAFGGTFGGGEGVDYNCLPATFEVDYVRVFTKEAANNS